MSSKIDICNQALIMLGALPIVSFEDGTVEANALNTVYEPAKSQTLRSYPWRCATKNVTLAKLAEAPLDPLWDFAFSTPDDSLRIVQIRLNSDKFATSIPWQIEGDTVLTRNDGVVCEYISDVPEPELDAHVEMVLAARLALDLSYTLTASNTREGTLYQMHDAKMNEARTTDRQEASHKVFNISQLATVRR